MITITGSRRDEVARILEIVATDGLPGPRDLDVAIDAIEAALQVPDDDDEAPNLRLGQAQREPASTPLNLVEVIDGICEAHATTMPDELQREIAAFMAAHKDNVDNLRNQVLAVLGIWLGEAAKRGSEIVVEQIALQQAHLALTLTAKAMKARRGEALLPGRMALAAYHFAAVANDIESGPLDLDGAAKLLSDLLTPLERERDRLRELVDEIADMDLGEPEVEHREIIARCREEQKRWEDG